MGKVKEEKKGMSDKLPSDQLEVLEEHWGNELEKEGTKGMSGFKSSDIRNELLTELEAIRRRLSRRRERKEITGEELKEGLDAIDRLKEIV